MKKTQILTMLILTSILMTFSCEKEKPEPTLPYQEVFGSWDWVSTTTGWGVTTYADSVSYDQTLEISRQGSYTWKRNDTIVREENFTVEVDTVESNEVYTFQFDNNDRVDQSFIIEHQDTLFLTDQCADCDSYIFVRH